MKDRKFENIVGWISVAIVLITAYGLFPQVFDGLLDTLTGILEPMKENLVEKIKAFDKGLQKAIAPRSF